MTAKIAMMHLEKGGIETARTIIISELEKDAKLPENWLVMGVVQATLRDYDWAAQSFEKYLQCMEDNHGTI